MEGSVAGFPAEGRVDLVFDCGGKGLVLADLKTGRPRGITAGNMLKEGRLQLPFYTALARQNGYTPVLSACYIHLEGNGDVTFEETSSGQLDSINDGFEAMVRETAEKMKSGAFPPEKEKKWRQKRR